MPTPEMAQTTQERLVAQVERFLEFPCGVFTGGISVDPHYHFDPDGYGLEFGIWPTGNAPNFELHSVKLVLAAGGPRIMAHFRRGHPIRFSGIWGDAQHTVLSVHYGDEMVEHWADHLSAMKIQVARFPGNPRPANTYEMYESEA